MIENKCKLCNISGYRVITYPYLPNMAMKTLHLCLLINKCWMKNNDGLFS